MAKTLSSGSFLSFFESPQLLVGMTPKIGIIFMIFVVHVTHMDVLKMKFFQMWGVCACMHDVWKGNGRIRRPELASHSGVRHGRFKWWDSIKCGIYSDWFLKIYFSHRNQHIGQHIVNRKISLVQVHLTYCISFSPLFCFILGRQSHVFALYSLLVRPVVLFTYIFSFILYLFSFRTPIFKSLTHIMCHRKCEINNVNNSCGFVCDYCKCIPNFRSTVWMKVSVLTSRRTAKSYQQRQHHCPYELLLLTGSIRMMLPHCCFIYKLGQYPRLLQQRTFPFPWISGFVTQLQ